MRQLGQVDLLKAASTRSRISSARQALHAQAKGHVFSDVQVREKSVILEHQAKTALVDRHIRQVAARPKAPARRSGVSIPGDNAQQGALPAARRSQQANCLAALHG